jgi:type VI secretion system secreted protein VgrG
MSLSNLRRTRRSRAAAVVASLSAFAVLGAILVLAGSSAAATPTTVGLGAADSFAVLAGTGITDVPTSAITGNVGLDPHPGSDITGLTCAEVNGKFYTNNASGPVCRTIDAGLLTNAKNDLTSAFGDAAGRTPTMTYLTTDDQLGHNQTLVPGVYRFGSATSANLTGPLTLSGSAGSVWIFQATSDLVFASGASVSMTGGASACNVFWVVNSSATLGTTSSISGTILALTSITANHGSQIDGRLLAQTGLVSLDTNTINRSACGASSGGPTSQPPGRALYCDASGKTYDLVAGEDKLPPYDALNLVPAYVDPVTGSQSCNFPTAVVTTPATTTTTATAPPTPPPVTTTSTPTPAPTPVAPRRTKGVKAAKVVRIKHVAPQPARHQGGFTG